MKKTIYLVFALLLITTASLSSCEKDESEASVVVVVPDPIVGKWFIKKYEEKWFENNVQGGLSSSVDFNSSDFMNFTAEGGYTRGTTTGTYKRDGSKVVITTNGSGREYTIQLITDKDLKLFYLINPGSSRSEVTLTLQK